MGYGGARADWQSSRAGKSAVRTIRRVKLPSIAFIVARSSQAHVIGCDNKLPWRLRTDLRRFRKLTLDHAVIMGRKTLDSIGHPLDRRLNIVVTREERNTNNPNLIFANNRESALFWADHYSILHNKDDFFVMGGEHAYKLFRDIYYKIYLTEVFCGNIQGDAHFHKKFDRRRWKIIEEEDHPASENDDYPFRYLTYERRMKYTRIREINEFYREYKEREDTISILEMRNVRNYIERNTIDIGDNNHMVQGDLWIGPKSS